MDLPERLLPRVASRIGVQRVSFNAYSRDQLKAILVNRLRAGNALEAFQDKALTICAARVAADGGDARKALQVCRRALEAVGRECWDEGKTDLIPRLQAVGILSLNKGSGVEDAGRTEPTSLGRPRTDEDVDDVAGASIPVLELGQSLDVEDVVNALVEDDLAKELLDVVPPSGPLTLN
eukprot:g13493.t1